MEPQPERKTPSAHPWRWVPTLYFSQGIPFVVISVVSVILYKDCGISNAEIAFYTSWLYLPWVIKGLWGPLVEKFGTRRDWILLTQFILGAGFGMIGLLLPLPFWFTATLILFWLLAFASATHDIAADGFYMDALDPHDQVWFTGIRNTFYRFAMIAGQGGLVMLVGWINAATGPLPLSVTLSAPGETAPAIHCLDVAAGVLTEEATVFDFQLPELYCAQPEQLIPRGKVPVEANALILDWVTQWNTVHANASADSIRIDLVDLRTKVDHVLAETSPDSELAGELVLVPYRLNAPPEKNETIQTTMRLERGESAMALIAGDRHKFTIDNWLKPAFAVFQYQAERLPPQTSATYVIRGGNQTLAWAVSIFMLCLVYLLFASYHLFALPQSRATEKNAKHPGFIESFARFFELPSVWAALAFVLLYRFGEAQLVKISPLFLMDAKSHGGLALTTGEVGLSGTIGTVCLLAGGILGSWAAARDGLKRWIWPMACAIHLPNIVYVYLAHTQPDNLNVVFACIAIEQFGYGFGFAGFMLYLLCFVEKSPMRTAHYALLTGFMALGMMMPGMFSGNLQEVLGYPSFFIWIVLSTIPGFLVVAFLKIPREFGIRRERS